MLLFNSCKDSKSGLEVDSAQISNQIDIIQTKSHLLGTVDFGVKLHNINSVENHGKEYSDWLTNNMHNFLFEDLFNLKLTDFKVSTTSFTYKEKCVFYLHNLKHTSDNLTFKPFLENSQNKRMGGYLQERIIIFAMKDDKEANFIDIPDKLNSMALRKELLQVLSGELDGDVILCYESENCTLKHYSKK